VRISLLSIAMLATIVATPFVSVSAQNTNPGNSAGSGQVATPTYETGGPANPALTTGILQKGATNIPADENPTVRGATGDTIVKGDRSTISGDRRATTQQKTGEGEEGGGN
jgi:hypothetical protein